MTFQRSNPFPRDTVVTNSIDELPDFRETESYRSALELVEDFSEEFPLSASTGRAMGIRGRFGSGKTHLIFQLMRELAAIKGAQCKPIYAKADKVDFLDLYINYFARKLEADDLRKVVSLHLAKLLRLKSRPAPDQNSNQSQPTPEGSNESLPSPEAKTLTQIAQEEVAQLILTDPQAVLTLVENDLLPVSGLNRDFDREIETTERKDALGSDGGNTTGSASAASNVSLDFFRAYSKLTDPTLSSLAVRWIQGSELLNAERVDLGLESTGITQPSIAKEAMRFLLAAFKKADFAVVFCLDEFERFSSRGTPADLNACAGLLKDLAEIFQKTGHLLIVSGIDDAWNAMPKDVFARIKTHDIVEMNLSESEAEGLVDVYCQASGTSFTSIFEANAFPLLYEASNHNARRLLDLSYRAYELATDGDTTWIKEQHVERAANQVLSSTERQYAVRDAIQTVAAELRLPVQTKFELDGLKCDYILGDEHSPQIAVEVTQSIFKLGEVSAARQIANLSRLIRKKFPRTAFCVVIVGYSTKEVRDDLARVVDRVFSFDEERFKTEFREFLKSVSLQPKEVEDRLKNQEAGYQDLLKKFDALESSRRSEIEQLKDALANLQATSVRTRETTREKRVTDKMEETLDGLDQLLDQEAEATFLSRRREEESTEKTLRNVLQLLEEQYNHIRRARILNERLPRAEEFLERLRQLDYLTAQAADEWHRSLSAAPYSTLSLEGDARRLFSERKRVLSDLQGIHFSRKPASGVSRILDGLRQNKLVTTLSLVFVIAGIAMLYSVYSGWNNEKLSINSFTSQLSAIQGKILIARLESDKPTAIKSVYSILTDAITLEATPTAQTYLVGGLTSTQVPEIRDQLVSVNNRVRNSSDESWGSGFARGDVDARLATINTLCARLQGNLGEITFGRFVLKFLSYHWLFTSFFLLPVFILLVLALRRRLQNRLFARRPPLPA